MEQSEINAIAVTWIENSGRFSEPWGKRLIDAQDSEPEAAFEIIKKIHQLLCSEAKINYGLMGLLAAAHLEHLLCDFGENFIDEIEVLANSNEEFSKLLCGVWQSEISDAVYARLEECMHPTHEFA